MRMHSKPVWSGFIAALTILLASVSIGPPVRAEQSIDPATVERFDYLSTHGNSNCSTAFMNSIATMPVTARLQGSCCSPMSLGRYGKQIEGLKKYSTYAEIPADPYDVPAGLAQRALANYDLALGTDEQRAYAYAMANSEEKGPCCCKCWRWHVYGGLAKLLIREHHFTGERVTEVWNLSDGCGGDEDPA
ncbi:MAG: hypothetical protein L0210_02010 [Rhodospirillales bacterium]|nr:hypothetical protein [Rhodospirillales bacterium]